MSRWSTTSNQWFLGAIGCFVIDRLLKQFAPLTASPFIDLPGLSLAWQSFQNQIGPLGIDVPLIVSLITFLLSLVLLLRLTNQLTLTERGSLSTALIGGLSNIIDRLSYGAVLDPLQLLVGSLPPLYFNIADIVILGGVIIAATSYARRTSFR